MSSRTNASGAFQDPETRGPAVWGAAASQIAASLRRAALLICVLALTGAVAGPLILSAFPPSFRATAQVVIDPRGIQVFPGEQGGPVLDANAGVNFVETQLQLFTSEKVLGRVVRAEKDKRGAGAPDEAAAPEGLGLRPSLGVEADAAEQRAIAALRRSLTIKRGERSFVIDVTAKSTTAERAAWLANAVVKAFMEEDQASRADWGRRLKDEIGGRLAALRQQLAQSETKAEAFRADHGLVSSGNDRLVSEQRLEQAVADLGTAQERVARATARVSQLDSATFDIASLGTLTAADDMRTISFLIERLSAAQEALADARLQFGPRHPTFESARSRVDTIERRIRAEIGRFREAEKTNLSRARAELEAGKRNVSELSAAVSKDRKASGDLRALYGEVKANQDLLAAFESRSREADEFSRVTPPIRVASAATADQSTSRLVLAIAMAIAGAVIGAMLGIAAALLWSFARPADRSAYADARPASRAGFEDASPTEEDPAGFRRRFTVHPSPGSR